MAIPADVRSALVNAYYPRALAVPDGARSRAQAAYGISSAIAAALVAAGVFGGLDQRPALVQALGVGALVGWLLAAGLYLVAVSRPFQSAAADQSSADAFASAALTAAKTERDKVDFWQKAAAFVSGLAAIVTVIALSSALVDTPTDARGATIVLSGKGMASMTAACGATRRALTGLVSPGDLEKEFVGMTLDAGECGAKKRFFAVPRSSVSAVAFSP